MPLYYRQVIKTDMNDTICHNNDILRAHIITPSQQGNHIKNMLVRNNQIIEMCLMMITDLKIDIEAVSWFARLT